MFVRLTRAMRLWSAGFLAVLYLICVLAPSAAFAFGDGSRAAHCLTDTNVAAHVHKKAAHVHKKSDAHSHSHDHGTAAGHQPSESGDDGVAANQPCCGLFCVSSLPITLIGVSDPEPPIAQPISLIAQGVQGNKPGCLYRPPISLS